MRVLVYGGRDFTDRRMAYLVLDRLHAPRLFTLLIHGDYRGADWIARDWARSRGIQDLPMAAEWKRYRRRAGPIRNQRMIDEGKPEFAVEFHGHDGTADMRARLVRAGIERCEVTITKPVVRAPFVVAVDDWWSGVNVQMVARAEGVELSTEDFGDPGVPGTHA